MIVFLIFYLGVILLISGDKDFGTSLEFKVKHGWIVLLAEPDASLKARAIRIYIRLVS